MKKLFVLFFLLFVYFPVSALTLDPSNDVVSNQTTLEITLKANPPSDNLNGISIRLKIENGEILNFEPANGEGWIGVTQDCEDNTKYFTNNNVCVSIAKSSAFLEDEILGTLTVSVNGTSTAKITKEEGNKYSNGELTIEDRGDGAVFFTEDALVNTAVSLPVSGSLSNNDNTILILALFIVIVVILIGVLLVLVKRKRNSTINYSSNSTNSKNKFFVLIAGIGLLILVTGVIGVSVLNNQAPDETSAYIPADCPSGTSQRTIAGTITCQCNNNSNITLNPGASNNLGCYPGNCPSYTTKKIVAGSATCQCNNSSEISINLNSTDATACYVGSCPSGTTKKVGQSGAYCQCNNNTEIALNLNASSSSPCGGSGSGAGSSGSGTGSNGGNTGATEGSTGATTGNGGTSGGGGTSVSTRKAICGESCSVDSDCAASTFGFATKCTGGKCVNPGCPTDTNPGTQCSCKTNAGKCGDRCGIWSDGFQPLCGDGISSCSWVNGPTCGGSNQTYCLPNTVPAGYQKRTCTSETSYKYIVDSTGKVVTSQDQIKQLCNPTTQEPTNTAPKGNFDSVSCEFASGWACDSDNWSANLTVQLYVDGPAGQGTLVGTAVANLDREAAVGEQCNGNKARGYKVNIPSNLYNTGNRTFYVHPVNVPAGSNPVSSGSPRTLNTATCTAQLPSCGNMDSNGDGKLTVIDFASFALMYNKSCSNAGFSPNSCGSRDSNGDGKIDIIDFASFSNRYDPKPSCAI